jgi:hypothetical protein
MKRPFEGRFAGLAAVRITWATAIVVCVLAIVSGLLSGTDGGNSSQQFPGFAFTDDGNASPPFTDFASLDPAAPLGPAAALVGGEAQQNTPKTQKTETAGPQGNRGRRVDEQAPGDGDSRAGVRHPGTQPEGADGGPPSSTPAPNRPQAPTVSPPEPETPQAPTVTVNVPEPPQAPSVSVNVPNPPQEPSGPSAPSLSLPQVSVHVSAPVETPLVKVPDVSVQLP